MSTITGITRGGAEWTPAFITGLNQTNCIGCGRCFKVCPRDVFELVDRDVDAKGAADRAREIGQQASQALVKELGGALMRALRGGGPAAAVAVCADTAQALTARIESECGFLQDVIAEVGPGGTAPASSAGIICARPSTGTNSGCRP